ncbi:pyridoxamine 5'-phosphate oxidase family protein [Desulfitibacter alkalitolerans]|uniref:pyridoxamine 5'-phosphate oxidase family protein n=1 Tax=Desulfitibacter alkalitolerans TaxID=264641 RepID=UPI001FA6EF3F|nr:pyridoxamine 5'-phosphate oxidase family protein [Desulfitibacter alkalitolerans]
MLSTEIKEVIVKSPYISIVTVSAEGKPHLIVVGKAAGIRNGNILAFDIYKMEKTQKNINENGIMQVAAVYGKKGYRFSGKACVKNKEVLFRVEAIEELL